MEEYIQRFNMTCNEEIDSYKIGDSTIILTGLITKLDEHRLLRANFGRQQENRESTRPVRYILDNLAGRKIRILFWKDRASEFTGRLVDHIVKISRAKVLSIKEQYRKAEEGLAPIEISILPHSKIEILERVQRQEVIEPEIIYQPVELRRSGSRLGDHVAIDGYIKLQVENVVFNNNYSYGSGSITDFRYKLTVNVTTFTETDLHEGAHVRVRGCLRESMGNVILQVARMEDFELIDDVIASPANLRNGFLPVEIEEQPQQQQQPFLQLPRHLLQPQPQPELQPQPQPELQPQPQLELQPQPQPELQLQPQPELQPQPQPELQPQPQPELQLQPQPELQPQLQPELQPQLQPKLQRQPQPANLPSPSAQNRQQPEVSMSRRRLELNGAETPNKLAKTDKNFPPLPKKR